MHHILLLLPILAIFLFFILPVVWALPLFLITLVLSLFAYWKALQALHQRAYSGLEHMVGERAVVETDTPQLRVEYKGELWSARSDSPVSVGESVIIIRVNGLNLWVTPENHARDSAGNRSAPFRQK